MPMEMFLYLLMMATMMSVPPVLPPKRSLWQRIKDWGMEGESHPPFAHPCAIRFQSGSQFPSFQDCTLHLRGEGVPDITYDNYEHDDEAVCDAYTEFVFAESVTDGRGCYNGGHRIGGYPEFTQEDPRALAPAYREYVQLMQLDSDDKHIMWGDAGVGHLDGVQAQVLGGVEDEGVDAAPAAVDRGGVDPGALGDLGDGDRPGTALLQQLNNGVQHRSAHAPGTAAGARSHGAHGAHGTGRATLPRLFTAARLHDISLGQRLASTTDRPLQS